MKKMMQSLLFLIAFGTTLMAQTTLDANQFVNDQITGPGVYLVETGKIYAFDGRLDVTWDITIQGPAVDWIGSAENPPVLVNTPGDDGLARQFMEIGTGGKVTLKNLMLSGLHSNGAVVGTFVANVGGEGFVADNVAAVDWQDFAFRNQFKGSVISLTNCVFLNGVRLSYSPWGGFPLRMDVACTDVTLENNTVFNSGRLIANSGPWLNATVHELHCTYVNQTVNGHEQRAYEMIQANNIFYNYHFVGRKTTSNVYDSYFTTWNYFADAKAKLDSISLYLGNNFFYRQPEIDNWFVTSGGDSILPSLLWEHANVDSFVTIDNNYKIGTNYAEFEIGFNNYPDILAKQIQFLDEYWYSANRGTDWPDWRVPSPVVWDTTTGIPSIAAWPPAMDLSYTNTYLQKAGTDGLPLGDLNWFPSKKAEFLTNKTAIIASLRDSIANAKALYVPGSATPMITPNMVSVKQLGSVIPQDYYLSNNYPNPFNPSTKITFGIPEQANVTVSVYNVLGQKVFELTEHNLAAGSHSFNFDASKLSSGIYVYSISTTNAAGQKFAASKKMMFLK